MKTALAAVVLLAAFGTGGAKAGSIVELGGTGEVSSIIMLGNDDPCAEGACGSQDDVEVVDAGSAAGSSGALVDEYGMPTKMPVVMRPSMDAPVAQPTPDASAPAATPAPEAQTPQPEPVKMEPAPQVETPQVEDNGQQQLEPKPE
jgi:hypothetical protein